MVPVYSDQTQVDLSASPPHLWGCGTCPHMVACRDRDLLRWRLRLIKWATATSVADAETLFNVIRGKIQRCNVGSSARAARQKLWDGRLSAKEYFADGLDPKLKIIQNTIDLREWGNYTRYFTAIPARAAVYYIISLQKYHQSRAI